VKDLVATPPVSRKRGRPLGSRNKKTLAALAAAAAIDSAGAAPATAAAPTGAVTTAATAMTPIEAAAAIVGAAVSVGAAPLASPLRAPMARLVPPPTW
jgi:hypothetical protein